MEIWKDIPGFIGYQASNLGRIKSLSRQVWQGKVFFTSKEKILTCQKDRINGYLTTKLSLNNIDRRMKVHRLVSMCFIPVISGKDFVNHKDGIKLNNTVENLEWCTKKENSRHAFDTGLIVRPKGEFHPRSKLTNIQVLEIKQKIKDGIRRRFIAKEYGISISAFKSLQSGQNWSSVKL